MHEAFEADSRIDGDNSARGRNQMMYVARAHKNVFQVTGAFLYAFQNLRTTPIAGMWFHDNCFSAAVSPLANQSGEFGYRNPGMVDLNVVSGELQRDQNIVSWEIWWKTNCRLGVFRYTGNESPSAPAFAKSFRGGGIYIFDYWVGLKTRVVGTPTFGVQGEGFAQMHLFVEEIAGPIATTTMGVDAEFRLGFGPDAIPFDDPAAQLYEAASKQILENTPLAATTDFMRLHPGGQPDV
jgi:hypothetical protein